MRYNGDIEEWPTIDSLDFGLEGHDFHEIYTG